MQSLSIIIKLSHNNAVKMIVVMDPISTMEELKGGNGTGDHGKAGVPEVKCVHCGLVMIIFAL